MKNKLTYIVLLALIIVLFISFYKQPVENNDIFKIGFQTDLTSFASYWGESSITGAKMAVDEMNSDGHNIELIITSPPLNTKGKVL